MDTTPPRWLIVFAHLFCFVFFPPVGVLLTANEIFPLLNTVKDVEKKDLYVEDGLQQSEERGKRRARRAGWVIEDVREVYGEEGLPCFLC